MLVTLIIGCLAASPTPDAPRELKVSLPIDGAVTAALAAGWIGSEALFKEQLAPAECRWCQSNPLDEWGRGIRGAPDQLLTLDKVSGVVDFGLLPIAVLGADALAALGDDQLKNLPVDAL